MTVQKSVIQITARAFVLAGVIGLVSGPAAAGKLYKWVDENGNVSYQDMPPPDGEKYKATHLSDKKLGRLVEEQADTKLTELAETTPITVYRINDCEPCDFVTSYLDQRGIPFVDKNVDGNEELKKELLNKAKKVHVPALTVGDDVVFGYKRSAIESALSAAGYPLKQPKKDGEEESSEKVTQN